MKTFDFTNPARWNFEAAVYLYSPSSEEGAEMAEEIMGAMADLNGVGYGEVNFYDYGQAMELATPESRFSVRGTCDHCGAHFHYGALYRSDEGEVAVVGNICASNKLNLTAHEYADKRLRELAKRARSVAEGNKREAALAPNRAEALKFDHYIVSDIRSKFRKYGSCSVKQWALVKKIKRETEEREARFAEEKANSNPIPSEILDVRSTISGEVVSTKWVENAYGGAYKMLVRDDRGFKVWGSVPASIDDTVYNGRADGKTIRVTFDAKIAASNDDETFGFFNRPTKAAASAA